MEVKTTSEPDQGMTQVGEILNTKTATKQTIGLL